MSKYKISVITPFHNVSKQLFQKTWNSMAQQTIGFKNIEWIIVMHNCTKAEVGFVTKMAKGHTNVKVKILNNNLQTPSSPKNYAMQFAHAKYIGYLDSDDTYTKNALEVAVSEAEANRVQICMFRMEYKLANRNVTAIDERTLWNQAEDRIIITQKNRDNYRLYADNFYFLTCKIFDRQFLLKNKIKFDENMPIAEDYYYAIQCFLKAKRIVYLPRHIGYHYNIHGSSISQSAQFDDETFLHYADAILKCIELPGKYGIKTDAAQGFCMWLATRILTLPNLKLETRMKVKQMFAPYIKNRITQKPNKLYPIERLVPRYWIPRLIIMNPKNPQKAFFDDYICNSIGSLTTILAQNINTDYAQKHKFNKVNSIEAYQKLPLMTAEDLQTYIKLQTNIGESDILINDKPSEYLIDKNGNLFMNTPFHFRLIEKTFADIFDNQKTFIVAQMSDKTYEPTNDKRLIKTLPEVLLRNYFMHYKEMYQTTAKFTSEDILYTKGLPKKEHYEKIIEQALRHKDITRIFAFDIKDLLYMFKVLQELRPSAKDIKKVWPKLNIVIGTNYTNSAAYYNKIKKYIGDVDFSNGLYFTELGILGAATRQIGVYEKFTDGNFYELQQTDGKVIKMSQAKLGQTYQLIVTNSAGLYRFVSNYKFEIIENDLGHLSYKILPSK